MHRLSRLTTRISRLAARVLAVGALAGLLAGVPALLVALVGRPYPSGAQLAGTWRTQQVDTDTVVRLGCAVFVCLWAWFAATALAELVQLVRWRTADRRRPLPPPGRGPGGLVRHLVRVAVLSSVTGVAALGPLLPARGAVSARAAVPMVTLRATVPAPLGPAHEVIRGDSYWRIADHRLEDRFGREPTGREVYDYTEDLIEFNAPRLGHRDPTLIHPGELVVFTPIPGDVPPPPHQRVEPDVIVTLPAVVAPPPTAPPTPPVTPPATPSASVPAAPSAAPSPPTAAPPVGARPDDPAPPAEAVFGDRREQGRVLSGLGAAVLVAVGATRVVAARRRRRLRAAAVGARLAPPTEAAVRAELTLRAHSREELLARLDLAVRAAATELAAQDARVVAAVLGDDGAVRLHLDGTATPDDASWRLDLDSGSWVLPADVPLELLAVAAGPTPPPCPALVCLGVLPEGRLFVDLEAIGVLAIDAPAGLADEIVRHLAASLAVSPFADGCREVTVGVGEQATLGSVRADEAESLDAALEAAATTIGSTTVASRGSSTFALRAASRGETWEPVIVLTGAAATAAAPSLAADAVALAGGGGHGLGIVTVGTVDGQADGAVRWVLRVGARGFLLEPLGIELTPVGLSSDDVAAVHALLVDADEPPVVHAEVVPLEAVTIGATDDGPAVPVVEPEWSLMVHVLGHVEVVSCDGEPAVFERGKSLELVAWLGQHRRHATRTGARTALWDLDVRDATFANVVSDARRAMARVVAPPEGEEWIGRTLTELLPLHEGVVTDAELLERRVARARGMRHADAVEVLRPGLELVTGMPFAGTSYLWPDAEGITSALTLLVTGAAIELAQHYLALGDAEGVFWATGQGLQVLAGHEELIALRMRAHAAAGDLAGVRHEWEAYERALAADPWAEGEPAPKLVALRRELLSPSLAS